MLEHSHSRVFLKARYIQKSLAPDDFRVLFFFVQCKCDKKRQMLILVRFKEKHFFKLIIH